MSLWIVVTMFSQEMYFASATTPEQCMKAAIVLYADLKEYLDQEQLPNVFRCVQIEVNNPFRGYST